MYSRYHTTVHVFFVLISLLLRQLYVLFSKLIILCNLSLTIYRGRLDKLLYVSLPTPEDRVSILKAVSTNITFSPDVDLNKIGVSSKADGYSGADCAALLREAGLAVLKESYESSISTKVQQESGTNLEPNNVDSSHGLCICPRHFDYAFAHVVPSVSRKDQARYLRMRDRMAHARSRGGVSNDAEIAKKGDDGVKESNCTDSNLLESSS